MNLDTPQSPRAVVPASPFSRPGRLLCLVVAMLLAGCAAQQEGADRHAASFIPPPLFAPPVAGDAAGTVPGSAAPRTDRRLLIGDTPQVPGPARVSTVKPGSPAPVQTDAAVTTLAFDQLPLPTFIQVVFGNILKASFSVDPTVMTRADLVTLRTGQPQTPSQVLETTRLLLKSYGVAVNDMGANVYRIVPDANQSAYLPEIRRGRAQPDIPLPLRPVFSLVELSAVRTGDVANWLKAMFGARLNIQEDGTRNALLLSGQAAEVAAAQEAIQVLDQPLMRARSSQLVTPTSLGVDDLARRLVEILTAEGYAAGVGAAPGLPVSLVPISASNALLLFAVDPEVLAHVVAWAKKLDSLDNDNRRSGNYFSYEVKYADAQALAKTLQELMAGQERTPAPPPGAVVIGVPRQPGRVVVNPATNTLIINTSNADEYAQLLTLMKALDKPSKSVLIEVTVAEVKVGGNNQLGIEWIFGPDAVGSGAVVGGTLGGLSLGTGGLTLSYLNNVGVVRARLNALASDNRARIVSSPRIMARNGEAATIQVGQEVPIVTSQQSSTSGTNVGGSGVILQTIQYRSTGVILRVKPIIFAGRVELDVQQEVSSAAATLTGVNISPTFSTRKIDTKLSIRDGATVALGGLISRVQGSGESGVPLLKDIPFLGQAFRTNTQTSDDTELIVLITPYVIESDLVAEQVTQALRGQLGRWAQPSGGPMPPPKYTTTQPPAVLLQPPSPAANTAAGSADAPYDQRVPAAAAPLVPEAKAPMPADATGGRSSLPATPAPGLAPHTHVTLPQGLSVPGGAAVTDAALLDELKRAGAAATAQGAPAAPAKAASQAQSNRPAQNTPVNGIRKAAQQPGKGEP